MSDEKDEKGKTETSAADESKLKVPTRAELADMADELAAHLLTSRHLKDLIRVCQDHIYVSEPWLNPDLQGLAFTDHTHLPCDKHGADCIQVEGVIIDIPKPYQGMKGLRSARIGKSKHYWTHTFSLHVVGDDVRFYDLKPVERTRVEELERQFNIECDSRSIDSGFPLPGLEQVQVIGVIIDASMGNVALLLDEDAPHPTDAVLREVLIAYGQRLHPQVKRISVSIMLEVGARSEPTAIETSESVVFLFDETEQGWLSLITQTSAA